MLGTSLTKTPIFGDDDPESACNIDTGASQEVCSVQNVTHIFVTVGGVHTLHFGNLGPSAA
jgi:hypothetical protein